jgi:diaminohydroxyphosphoribosylaminopyrimidine deaminase/5-amino-6-(5-phosphoribosylamino)uracil reductase
MERNYLSLALRLARRGYGRTSPNPMVGAVLVKKGKIIGQGWHHRAGQPHAEIEALRAARENPRGATLFITLEPCSTHGRTPPCTDAIITGGIKNVVVATLDPNPAHQGRGIKILERAGISVHTGLLAEESERLNESFNHWIVHRTPFVTLKAAMSLDGKIATRTGESKWITGERARACGMTLRAGADAILVGVNTIIQDDPSLTLRKAGFKDKVLRRFILDPSGRIPLQARVITDALAATTTVVVTKSANPQHVAALQSRVHVLKAPERKGRIDLRWLLQKMGSENITSLLIEGGGETNAIFLEQGMVDRLVFFYAPIVLGGNDAPKAVGGEGVLQLKDRVALQNVEWRQLGPDLLLTARVTPSP